MAHAALAAHAGTHAAMTLRAVRLAGSSLERRALTLLVAGARGVEPDSVRVSNETASLAVVFNPARVRLSAVQQAIENRLKPRGLSLLPLQVMDRAPGAKRPQ